MTDDPSLVSDCSLPVKMPQSRCTPNIPRAEASVKVEGRNGRTAGKSTSGTFTVSRFAGIMPEKRSVHVLQHYEAIKDALGEVGVKAWFLGVYLLVTQVKYI